MRLATHTPQIAALLRELRAIPVAPTAVDRFIAEWKIHRIAGGAEHEEMQEWEGPGPDPDAGRGWRDNRRRWLDLRGGW